MPCILVLVIGRAPIENDIRGLRQFAIDIGIVAQLSRRATPNLSLPRLQRRSHTARSRRFADIDAPSGVSQGTDEIFDALFGKYGLPQESAIVRR